jgi:predicted house-cleaning noncanonical NTP pyrophosphatase (MazG superfamily)
MVQTTFTKQKRELAKALSWIEKNRAQEVRNLTYNSKEELQEEVRETYVDYSPEEITQKVLKIVKDVVNQHGARQKANSQNTGRFQWYEINIDLTVPQLRALQSAYTVLHELVRKLPRRNPKLIYNTTINNRPAFAHLKEKYEETKTRYVPYEEDSTTRVRTYEEKYDVVTQYTQKVEIDYGLEIKLLNELNEMIDDLGTAIQMAIDDANTKGRENDPVIDDVINRIGEILLAKLPNSEQPS